MSRTIDSKKAFTLIEVMMAATVLVVSFTAVIQAVMMGNDKIDLARKQQIALQIIDGEIAFQRTRTWSSIIPGIPGISNIPSPPASVSITISSDGTTYTDNTPSNALFDYQYLGLDDSRALMAEAKGFTLKAQSIPMRDSFISITYTVTWTGYMGRLHSRTGVGHFGKNGLHLSYQR